MNPGIATLMRPLSTLHALANTTPVAPAVMTINRPSAANVRASGAIRD
jgi:hypothetical protein